MINETIVVNRKEYDKFIQILPGIIKKSAEDAARETINGSLKYYKKSVLQGLKEKTRHKVHTPSEESISRLRVEEKIGTKSTFKLIQPARAGIMMEVPKKSVGGKTMKDGNQWLLKGMNPRIDKYLNAIGKEAIIISNNQLTGRDPWKPMKRTYDEYVVKEIGNKLEKEVYYAIVSRLSQKINPKEIMGE